MLGVVVLLACVGLSAGSIPAPKHQVGCYSYHDEAAKYKLSDTFDGYPREEIERELSARPYMRPVLFDHHTIKLPHLPVQPVRRYKRSYATDVFGKGNIRRNPPTYPNRVPVRPVRPIHQKPVHPIHPRPNHPIHPKPVHSIHPRPVHPIHPQPVHPFQPKPVHPFQPKPVHPIHPRPVPRPFRPNPVRPVIVKPQHHAYKQVKPIGEACPTRKHQLRRFWSYEGDCYVVNPSYQKITYASCSKRDCSNCAYTKKHFYGPKPVNRCVASYETEQVWAYCHRGGVYNQRIMRVSLSLPKYCSCKTFKC